MSLLDGSQSISGERGIRPLILGVQPRRDILRAAGIAFIVQTELMKQGTESGDIKSTLVCFIHLGKHPM